MRGGTGILQSGPRKDSNQRNWVLAHRTKKLQFAGRIPATAIAGGEGEPAGEDQGTKAVLSTGDV
jgi:hypothetical protein